ncbi:cyclic phosphodiesterase-like [Argentina anserina]|uniref:cyclic phosphodiesterase-like n=1 Tax=Argentina anserina TaxID=57926 RepID=UPI0021766C6F|nr:cyclic phosphodiesterase-like [Potentilla anserina]
MANQSEPGSASSTTDDLKLYRWAAWAIPPDNICKRVKKVMEALREEFGGPEIKPHITVAGSCLFTRSDAIERFTHACGSVNPIVYQVDQLETSKFYFQCVSLVFKTEDEFTRETGIFASRMHCSSANMPHLSLIFGDYTDEEKKRAEEIVKSVDEELCTMIFTVTRMQLYKINFEDKTQKSWELFYESTLRHQINN